MVKFKDYILNESVGYQKIDAEEIVKYKSQILAAASYPTIYRGMESSADYILGDGNLLNRKSRNTDNLYNMLMSEILPSWNRYPKRSKSFICSLDENFANGYGDLFIVIPLENQDIGMCAGTDIWESLHHLEKKFYANGIKYSDATSFNERMNELMRYYYDQEIDSDSKETCLKHLSLIEKEILDDTNIMKDKSVSPLLSLLKKELEDRPLISVLDGWFSPKLNRFNLVKPYQLPDMAANEVWMSGKVLFISEENYKETILSLRK